MYCGACGKFDESKSFLFTCTSCLLDGRHFNFSTVVDTPVVARLLGTNLLLPHNILIPETAIITTTHSTDRLAVKWKKRWADMNSIERGLCDPTVMATGKIVL